MSLSERAVRRPVTTYMVFVAVVILGAVSLRRLAIDLLPEIDFPAISVFTTYEGVGPEEMETLITRPIEESVSTVQGLDRIESFSAEGRSRVQLRFAWGTSLDTALNDVRAAVERIRAELPEEAETPVVFKFDLSSFPIMMLTLSGKLDSWRLRHLAEEKIKYRLERVEGVAAVNVRGGDLREIHVDLDADRLAALGITAGEVAAALRRDNVNLPAGDVRSRGREVIVRTLGEYKNLSQMGAVVVATRSGSPVRVRDLGQVRDSHQDPVNEVFVDGKPAIRLSISKLPGANTVEVAARVHREVARIKSEMPKIQLRSRFDTSDYIQQSISNVQQGVLYGAGLAVFVLLFFLRSVRATAIVATAIPIASVGTFALMYLSGFTLNMISFGGLALGIGLLVDNAIVIQENIQRHREGGAAPRDAAVRGAGEVANAIVASTMTTLCIFLPVIFVGGFARIFFGQMAYVVSFALLCALAVALTLVPVLSSRTRKRKREEGRLARTVGRALESMERGYSALLRRALRRRKTVYIVANLLFFGSLALFPLVGTELMPMGDQGEVQIEAELPVGTPLERTAKSMHDAEKIIRRNAPESEVVMSVAGPPGFWSDAGSNAASLRVGLVKLGRRERSSEEVAGALRAPLSRIPDFKPRVRAGEGLWIFRLLRGGGERLAVEIRGFDLETGTRLAQRVAGVMKQAPGVVDVDIDRKEGNQEAAIHIDADKASNLGLTVGGIASTVSTYVLGSAATYFRDLGDEFRILVQLQEKDRYTVDQLAGLPIITPKGDRIALADVATIERRQGPLVVRRLNQERIVTVSAGYAGKDLGSVVKTLGERLAQIVRPEGFTIDFGGEFAEQRKTFGELLIGLLLALALVYMVMASLFESFLHPLVMLLSIPFAVIGVLVALLSTGTTLNVNSFLGMIVLTGIVVNNAIVLVDYINLLRREGELELEQAVVEAGRRRLRPILMTTLTTVLALMPVAIGMGEGGELQAPLARVVVGGLLTSALITLVFVPTLYVTLERLRARRRKQPAAAG
jgi:HAE1 family hydrophobic/amphiphilic exporter-1